MQNNNARGFRERTKLQTVLRIVLGGLRGLDEVYRALRSRFTVFSDVARLAQNKEPPLQVYADISDTKHLRVEAERLRQRSELVRLQNVD